MALQRLNNRLIGVATLTEKTKLHRPSSLTRMSDLVDRIKLHFGSLLVSGAFAGLLVGFMLSLFYLLWDPAPSLAFYANVLILCIVGGALLSAVCFTLAAIFGGRSGQTGIGANGSVIGGVFGGLVVGALLDVASRFLGQYSTQSPPPIPLWIYALAISLGLYTLAAVAVSRIAVDAEKRRVLITILNSASVVFVVGVIVGIAGFITPLKDSILGLLSRAPLSITGLLGSAIVGAVVGLSIGLMVQSWLRGPPDRNSFTVRITHPRNPIRRIISTMTNWIDTLRTADPGITGPSGTIRWIFSGFVWTVISVLPTAVVAALAYVLLSLPPNPDFAREVLPFALSLLVVGALYLSSRAEARRLHQTPDEIYVAGIAKATHVAKTTFELRIEQALEWLFGSFDKPSPESRSPLAQLTLDGAAPVKQRVWVFSDQHRGARNKADDFAGAATTYLLLLKKALQDLEQGEHDTTIVLLGDIEELWEEDLEDIVRTYPQIYHYENKLIHLNRLVRVWGNHDIDYQIKNSAASRGLRDLIDAHSSEADTDFHNGADERVLKVASKARAGKAKTDFPIYERIRLEILKEGSICARVLMAHGYQGTIESDLTIVFSRIFVRSVWRFLQNVWGISYNTPAKNAVLADQHDKAIAGWIDSYNQQATSVNGKSAGGDGSNAARVPTLLITGHTHHPYLGSGQDDTKLRGTTKSAYYINSGCCCFSDRSISYVEINSEGVNLWNVIASPDINPDTTRQHPYGSLSFDQGSGIRPTQLSSEANSPQ